MHTERRQSARSATHCKISAQVVPAAGVPLEGTSLLEGELCNASQGGCCVSSQRGCPVSTVLECRIFSASLPDGIPTLMQVRWTRRDPARGFAFGAVFLVG
jgi:hypothetical protein